MRQRGDSAGAVPIKRAKKSATHGASADTPGSIADLLAPIAGPPVAGAAQQKAKPISASGRALDEQLAKLGIARDQDLALHLPLRYEDHTRVVPLHALVPGAAAQSEGVVVRTDIQYRPRRQLVALIAEDSEQRNGNGQLVLRFFHFYPSMQKSLAQGKHVMVGGIDAENAGSRRFHERLGFVSAGHFREVGHKFGRWLDLVFVQRWLDTPGAQRS